MISIIIIISSGGSSGSSVSTRSLSVAAIVEVRANDQYLYLKFVWFQLRKNVVRSSLPSAAIDPVQRRAATTPAAIAGNTDWPVLQSKQRKSTDLAAFKRRQAANSNDSER